MNENIDYVSTSSPESNSGPFLAKVVSQLDPGYSGMLEVEILRPVGSGRAAGQTHQVKMMSPFWGQTSVDFITGDPNDYNNTQKSYGMWFVPPDVGTTVVVIFINGDPKRGYWIGCVPDEGINFMVPGIAATEYVVEGGGRLPVAEYNKAVNTEASEPTKVKKPKHPLADVLEQQGLLKDDIRGITTSSARREVPSAVFGISTPGPVDKRSGAKTGTVGKADWKQHNVFVSRLGGTSFVMDDGDDKFLRKTHAKDGPPEYAALEQGETGGQKTIPHNELVRIRTRTGHQILMHNSEDLIYIGNSRGTTWIELTSNGKIDIYAKDSVSIHTQNDLNVTADRDINLTAGRSINLNAGTDINQQSGANFNLKVGAAGKITTGGTLDIKAAGATKITGNGIDVKSAGAIKNEAGGVFSAKGSSVDLDGGAVNLNCGAAGSASSAADAPAAPKATRIPTAEPWAGHENLNPTNHVPDKTTASTEEQSPASPSYYKKYTTSVDTFRNEKPAETGGA